MFRPSLPTYQVETIKIIISVITLDFNYHVSPFLYTLVLIFTTGIPHVWTFASHRLSTSGVGSGSKCHPPVLGKYPKLKYPFRKLFYPLDLLIEQTK